MLLLSIPPAICRMAQDVSVVPESAVVGNTVPSNVITHYLYSISRCFCRHEAGDYACVEVGSWQRWLQQERLLSRLERSFNSQSATGKDGGQRKKCFPSRGYCSD